MARKQAQYHLNLIDSLLRNEPSSLNRGEAPRMTSQIPKVIIYPVFSDCQIFAPFLHLPFSISIYDSPNLSLHPTVRLVPALAGGQTLACSSLDIRSR